MTAKQMALGGVTAALAVVILCLGGLVPFATYVLTMICCILLQLILPSVGNRGGWIWYCAVSALAVMLCPDKEAAATMVFLGWYPMFKPKLDQMPLGMIVKFLLFNLAVCAMYSLLIGLLGFDGLKAEFEELGIWLTVAVLALGNLCFYLLDRVLSRFLKIKNRSV